jgi:uncharacterized protein YneF (UPF0154 family)
MTGDQKMTLVFVWGVVVLALGVAGGIYLLFTTVLR